MGNPSLINGYLLNIQYRLVYEVFTQELVAAHQDDLDAARECGLLTPQGIGNFDCCALIGDYRGFPSPHSDGYMVIKHLSVGGV